MNHLELLGQEIGRIASTHRKKTFKSYGVDITLGDEILTYNVTCFIRSYDEFTEIELDRIEQIDESGEPCYLLGQDELDEVEKWFFHHKDNSI